MTEYLRNKWRSMARHRYNRAAKNEIMYFSGNDNSQPRYGVDKVVNSNTI